ASRLRGRRLCAGAANDALSRRRIRSRRHQGCQRAARTHRGRPHSDRRPPRLPGAPRVPHLRLRPPMTHRAALPLFLSMALSATAGCGGADVDGGQTEEERLAPLNLYPLREGHVWSYNVDTGTDLPTLTITRV